MADARRIYWDACAWIGLINNEAAKNPPLKIIWEAAQKGEFEIWTSAYSYLEVIKGKAVHGDPYPPERSDEIVFEMLSQPHVMVAQVDSEIAKLARRLRRDHNGTLNSRPDAIHLATALHYDAEELHTWDGSHLLPLDKLCACKNGKQLRVVKPGPETHGPLFAERANEKQAS